MIKLITGIIILVGLHWVPAVAQTPAAVDSFFETAYTAYRNQELETAVNSAFEIDRISREIKYEKGQARAYILIADCLMFQGLYRECLEYVNKAEVFKNYLRSSPYDRWILRRIAFESYDFLGLKVMARQEYQNALSVLTLEQDKHKRSLGLLYMYATAGGLLFDEADSVQSHLNRALELMKDEDFKKEQKDHYNTNLATIYTKLGDFHIKASHPDSALYFYDLAAALLDSSATYFYNARLYNGYSLLFETTGDYRRAISFMLKSLDICLTHHIQDYVLVAYNKLSDLYGKTGDWEQRNRYLGYAGALRDSLDASKAEGRDQTILYLIQKNETEMRQSGLKYRYIIAGITSGIGVLSLLGYISFKKYTRKKRNLLAEKEHQIREKERLLAEQEQVLTDSMKMIGEKLHRTEQLNNLVKAREEEVQELRQKLNESFGEIVSMAKANDPHFWTRFQEVYPHFASRLTAVNPGMKISELTFCAYLYIGFTTKEIAAYTFKALKTIENNRYNLRKKLQLDPSVDLVIWLNDIMR